jgi:uncharacterized protein (DUF1800 family)
MLGKRSDVMSEMNIDPTWAWQPFEPSPATPWNRALAAHLYRRAGFGADSAMLAAAVSRQPVEVVEDLVSKNSEDSAFRQTADALAETVLNGGDPKRLSAAWVYRLLYTPNQLPEKTTLFWHGHFATSADKVTDARMMWNQNQVLRDHALGQFDQLVQEIARDPAMLIYLDSAINRKAHPNENFARELMELFCLGEGNYSEQDVQELARCFTGWEVKNKKFRKNSYQHDSGVKSIFDKSGNFDGEDGVRVVIERPQLEQFLARKWYCYFIADEPAPTTALLQPVADAFRASGLQVAPVLKMMLQSNLFFSQHAVGRKIKSPVELVIGTLRCLQATSNTQLIAEGLLKVGQGLFYPPNVKGWDGGRTWINSSTLLGRSNLLADILRNEATKFNGQTLTAYLASQDVLTADQAIDHFESCLLPTACDEPLRARLRATAESKDPEQMFRSLLHAFTSLPQCQLG